MTNALRRPQPSLEDPVFAPYFDGLRRGELTVQYCPDHGVQWPPREMCLVCGNPEPQWTQVSGEGVVYTFAVSYRAFNPYFADRLPVGVAVVELAVGVRLMGAWEGPIEALACGARATAVPLVGEGAPILRWFPA